MYGAEIIFLVSLGFPVMKLLQENDEEPNHMHRRINQIIEFNELREKEYDRVQVHQENIMKTFERRVKEEQFHINDLVLKWDARKDDKHGKFDHIWKGPYIIVAYRGDNCFILQNQNGVDIKGGPVYGRFLKHYLS